MRRIKSLIVVTLLLGAFALMTIGATATSCLQGCANFMEVAKTATVNSQKAVQSALLTKALISQAKGYSSSSGAPRMYAASVLGSKSVFAAKFSTTVDTVFTDTGHILTSTELKTNSDGTNETTKIKLQFDTTANYQSGDVYDTSIFSTKIALLELSGSKAYTKDNASKPKNTTESWTGVVTSYSTDTYNILIWTNTVSPTYKSYLTGARYVIMNVTGSASFPAGSPKSKEEISGQVKMTWSDSFVPSMEIVDKLTVTATYSNGTVEVSTIKINTDKSMTITFTKTKQDGKKETGSATVMADGEIKDMTSTDESGGTYTGKMSAPDKTTGNRTGSGTYTGADKTVLDITTEINGSLTPTYEPDDIITMSFTITDADGKKFGTGKITTNPDGSGTGQINDANGKLLATFVIGANGDVTITDATTNQTTKVTA